MRRIQSLFKTLLMLIPMTAVPVMAIFGIPQFFPVSASPSARTSDPAATGRMLERRVGQSDALFVRSILTERTPSIDLFQPYDSAAAQRPNSASVVANAPSNELARQRLAWRDPLAGSANSRTEVSLRTTSTAGTRRSAIPAAAAVRRHVEEVEESARHDGAASFSGLAAVPSRLLESRSAELSSSAIGSDGTATTSVGIVRDPGNTARFSRATTGGMAASSTPRAAQVETLTWQQAVDRLNQMGIRTFRLTQNSGQNGYRFVCLVTSVDDPRISRRFEAESTDPLVAVGEVIVQVENWNQHR